MRIEADHKKLQYCGRIDMRNPKAPVFVYPCTSVKMRFTGEILKIHIQNRNVYWDNFLGCILDGKQMSLSLPKEGEAVLEIPVKKTESREHEVLFFKRQDSCHELTITGFEVEENAQIHDIAQGGIALMDKTGWFCEPDAVGMESVWDKIEYQPFLGPAVKWNFGNYTPQVVIVAIAQNDSHTVDYMKEDYDGERSVTWREHYEAFLAKLRAQYPDAHIICCTTLLEHDPNWDRSVEEAAQKANDPKITHYLFRRNGKGTPGHLRIPEAQEMSEELTAYIKSLKIEGWN